MCIRDRVWVAGAVEIGAGVAILLPPFNGAGLAVAGLLLLAYFAAIGLNLQRGRRAIDCGCGAPGRAQGLSAGLLVRNAVLALAALVSSAAQPLARDVAWFDWLVAIAAALTVILIYLSASLLLANNHLLVRLK